MIDEKMLVSCSCGGMPRVMGRHFTDGTHEWWIECRKCGKSTTHNGDFDRVLEDWQRLVTE